MKTSGADVFNFLVDHKGEVSNLLNSSVGKIKVNLFCCKQRLVLFGQCVFWFLQNAGKVFLGKCLQLYADGKSSLQFRDQIGRLAHVKSTSGNK